MARFYNIHEIVDSLCLLSGDLQRRNKGIYLEASEQVWYDLNEDILKIAKTVKVPFRQTFCIDKKTNSINIPKNFLRVSSVNAIDSYGCFYPIYRNDKISDDIVDVGASDNCACENNCNGTLCNTVKGYEAVTSIKSDVLPDSTPISFSCVDKKVLDNQGFVYSQTQYPQRIYLSGVWTDTIKYTENKKLCQVDIDTNGCICDSETNLTILCDSCGINNSNPLMVYGGTSVAPPVCEPGATTWTYGCGSRMEWFNVQCGGYPYGCRPEFNNIYNISQEGNRLIFPSNFGWDNVMIRFYEDIDLKDMQIPYMAKECFMTGLQYFAARHHDKKQKIAALYEQKYSKQKWGLFLELNKYRITELKEIFTPKMFVPSYINNPKHNWWI